MVSSRKHWLRTLLAGMGIIAASVGASTASAQSIDPFRPYNSQYDAYRYPIGPATPEGGQSVPMALSGVRGANQYQNYLDQLQAQGEKEPNVMALECPTIARQSILVSTPKAIENTVRTAEQIARSSKLRR